MSAIKDTTTISRNFAVFVRRVMSTEHMLTMLDEFDDEGWKVIHFEAFGIPSQLIPNQVDEFIRLLCTRSGARNWKHAQLATGLESTPETERGAPGMAHGDLDGNPSDRAPGGVPGGGT